MFLQTRVERLWQHVAWHYISKEPKRRAFRSLLHSMNWQDTQRFKIACMQKYARLSGKTTASSRLKHSMKWNIWKMFSWKDFASTRRFYTWLKTAPKITHCQASKIIRQLQLSQALPFSFPFEPYMRKFWICWSRALVWLSFNSHSDPEHFPEPEKFNPDRFDDPAVRNSPVYLPFGSGPRVCVGLRLASAQVRLALLHVVKNFRLNVSPNQKPMVVDPLGFMLVSKDGLLINFEQRSADAVEDAFK